MLSAGQQSRSNWNLDMLVFEERGILEYPEKNLSEEEREPTTNSTHIITLSPGIEPRPHWWKASALTSVPSQAHTCLISLPHVTEQNSSHAFYCSLLKFICSAFTVILVAGGKTFNIILHVNNALYM